MAPGTLYADSPQADLYSKQEAVKLELGCRDGGENVHVNVLQVGTLVRLCLREKAYSKQWS